MTKFNELFAAVREAQDWERGVRYPTPSDHDIEQFYAERLNLIDHKPDRPNVAVSLGSWLRSVRGWPLVCAGAVAACMLLLFGIFVQDGLSFTVAGEGAGSTEAGRLDVWLASEREQQLSFSDGTQVSLAGGAEASVTNTTTAGAELTLARGSAELQVIPRHNSRWSVVAGPYRVTVKGTVFAVNWDVSRKLLQVQVSRGSVSVSGGHIQREMLLVRGQRLVASAEQETIELTPVATPSTDVAQPAASEPVSESIEGVQSPGADEGALLRKKPQELPIVTAEASPPERTVEEEVSIKEEVAVEEEVVVEEELEEAPVTARELMRRVDRARAAGQSEQATRLLLQIREQFAGSPEAFVAAYTLGVIAFRQRGSNHQAVRWFKTYLKESPGGPLAREALGQLMEAYGRVGDVSAARQYARRYLKHYPKGPHRRAAREVLQTRKRVRK